MAKKPIGYYGVIIPAYNFYQGFFLYEDSGVNNRLAALRQVPFPLAETMAPASGVSDADQGLLGALSATLVEAARTQNAALLFHTGAAISVLADSKYFMVQGTMDASGGIYSDFRRMPEDVSSHVAAVTYIHSLPEVQAIQAHLLKEAAERIGKKQH